LSKIIALDFGLKRTGVAITDDLNIIALPLPTVESKVLMAFLKEIVVKEKIETLVLGLPKRLNNENTHITENVLLLKEALEKQFILLKVILHDERFTSKMASAAMHTAGANKKQLKDKKLVDQVSATIILQSFLAGKY
jgi:putative Holliday junction resolvase